MHQLKSVAWLHQDGDKLLCVKTKGKDKFFIPGGKLEAGETNELGLQREIQEELGIELKVDTIRHQFSIEDIAYGLDNTQLTMHCYTADFRGELAPNAEIEVMEWFDLSQIDLCAPAAQKALIRVSGSQSR
ncbi:NUDIX hydrolase [Photobacterium sp. TY1-4]|uniref:NUDIX hydrolase n=1 Tax=Photobacterium sp. TY1-4 TaxID=2899122 RepID=UPI0021C140FA|nr:NUDIX domain-containing protein [Photobacterium sp. TY1-4]UXI04211.1 NUDIX domain-containing protein [Photobacterium sp. TY1-4]